MKWLIAATLLLSHVVAVPSAQAKMGADEFHWSSYPTESRFIPAWLTIDGGGSKVMASVIALLPQSNTPQVVASVQTVAQRGLKTLTHQIKEVAFDAVFEARHADKHLSLKKGLYVALPGEYRHGGYTVRTGENLALHPTEWNGVDLRQVFSKTFDALSSSDIFVISDGPAAAFGRVDLLRDSVSGLLKPNSALKVIKLGTGTGRGLIYTDQRGMLHLGSTHVGLTSLPAQRFSFSEKIGDIDVSLRVDNKAGGFKLEFVRDNQCLYRQAVPSRLGRHWSNLMSGKDISTMLGHLERGLTVTMRRPVLANAADHARMPIGTPLLNKVVLTDPRAPLLAKQAARWTGKLAGHALGQLLEGLHSGALRHARWSNTEQRILQHPETRYLLCGTFAHTKAPLGKIIGSTAQNMLRHKVHFTQSTAADTHQAAIGAWTAFSSRSNAIRQPKHSAVKGRHRL